MHLSLTLQTIDKTLSEAQLVCSRIRYSLPTIRTLIEVYKRDSMCVREIAEHVGITQQGVGKMLSELIAEDVIQEVVDENDGRKRVVELTPKGYRRMFTIQGVWH